MTDFYKLLKQSIIERDVRDARDREAIYAQAREAIVRQLWAYKPPLAADEIDGRVGAYDQAVERIERDLRKAFAGRGGATGVREARPPAREPPSRRRAEPPPPPPPPSTVHEDEEDAFRSPRARGRRNPFDEDDEDASVDEEAIELPAPPIAEWRHDDEDEPDAEYAYDDPEDPPPAIPRAREPLPVPRRAASYEVADDRRDDDGDRRHDEETGWRGYDDAVYGDDDLDQEDDRRPLPLPARRSQQRRSPGYDARLTDEDDGAMPVHPRRPAARKARRLRWWTALAERHAVQMLAGAIAALLIALVLFGGYLLFFARGTGEAAATAPPAVTNGAEVRREISDAATAARIAAEDFAVAQSYVLFDGTDPTVFASTPDNPLRFASEAGFVRVSSTASAPGVRAIIGPGLAERLAGQRVRIAILARATPEFGAMSMRFAYQSGLAVSHWQTANMSTDYQAVAMIWRLPAMRTDPNADYLLIEPGIPGDGTGIDIRAIRIDVLADQS